MSSFRVRPRFEQRVELSPEVAQELLARALAASPRGFELKNFPGYLALYPPPAERHFWSPRLTLSLEPAEGGGTVVHGIYGPDTEVWTMFLYGYLFSGTAGLFAAILGVSQLVLGLPAWGLWVLGAMLLLAAGLYVAAQLGQKIGAQQTFELHQAYEAAIGRPTEVR